MNIIFDIIKFSIYEVLRFVSTHMLSGMLPAFIIAAGIYVFIDKHKITVYLGKNSPKFLSYTISSFAGAILTVCSCGVVPIFTSIYKHGAGIGPAVTFLFSAPAVNVISLIYTNSFLGIKFMFARLVLVMIMSILIGISMELLSIYKSNSNDHNIIKKYDANFYTCYEDYDKYWLYKIIILFGLLLLIMLSGTGLLDELFKSCLSYFGVLSSVYFIGFKALAILFEYVVFCVYTVYFFSYYELKLLILKSLELMKIILPKMFIGIFITSIFTFLINYADVKIVSFIDQNLFLSNLLSAFVGTLMYFGSIVGVNIVATLINFGMDVGPAMSLLLAGPSVSLPSLLSILSVVGKKYTIFFFCMVVLYSSLFGWIFGILYKIL